MSASNNSLAADLASVLGMAQSYIEDIETGLADGSYEACENQNIDAMNASVKRIQALHDKLSSFESSSQAGPSETLKDAPRERETQR